MCARSSGIPATPCQDDVSPSASQYCHIPRTVCAGKRRLSPLARSFVNNPVHDLHKEAICKEEQNRVNGPNMDMTVTQACGLYSHLTLCSRRGLLNYWLHPAPVWGSREGKTVCPSHTLLL